MAKAAKFVDGVVVDLLVPVEGFTLEECFHPDLLAQYELVEDDVYLGYPLTAEPAPEPETPTEEAPPA